MIFFVVLTLWVGPRFSYADWGHAGYHGSHHYYRYHDHPRFGLHVSAFYPDEYYPVSVGGARYYYDDGVYYNYVRVGDYVVVTPPTGAIVSTIPSDFQPVVVNGVTYYANNGTYYAYTSQGYRVVSPPAIQAAPVVATQNIFTINVPSDKGGYTSIVLKRSGNGFVGPQGEFYAQFPRVSQLKMMYGR